MSQGSKILATIVLMAVFFFALEYFHFPSGKMAVKDWEKTIEHNFYLRSQQSLEEIHQDKYLKLTIDFCKKEISKIFSSLILTSTSLTARGK